MSAWEDKTVLVTGGGSGIGEALAVAAKDAGARHVVVADLDADEAKRVAGAVGGTGAGLDVSDESAIRNLVDEIERARQVIATLVTQNQE